jgi:hypothetical protein
MESVQGSPKRSGSKMDLAKKIATTVNEPIGTEGKKGRRQKKIDSVAWPDI